MQSLKILIDGEQADFERDADFPLVFKRESIDFREPSRRKAERSYKCKFPLTKRNERIFGPLKMLSQINKFRTARTFPAAVYHGDLLIAEGVFKIDEVAYEEISGVIYANAASVAVALEGSLRDLDAGEVSFLGWQTIKDNLEEFAASANSTNFLHTEALLTFPFVSYANPFIPNRWARGNYVDVTPPEYYEDLFGEVVDLPDGKEIAGSDTYAIEEKSLSHFGFQDVPPAFYVVPILRAIFARAGYELAGSWIKDDNVRRLLLPFVSDRPVIYNWSLLCNSQHFDPPGGTPQGLYVWRRYEQNLNDGKFTIKTTPPPPGQPEYFTTQYNTGVYTGFGADDPATNLAAKYWITARELIADRTAADYGHINNSTRRPAPQDYAGSTRLSIPETAEYKFEFEFKVDEVRNWDSFGPAPLNTADPALRFGGFSVGLSVNDAANNRIDHNATLYDDATALAIEEILCYKRLALSDIGSTFTLDSGWQRIERGKQVVPFAAMAFPFQFTEQTKTAQSSGGTTIFGIPSSFTTLDINNIYPGLSVSEVKISVQCRPAADGPDFGFNFQIAPNLPDVKIKDFVQSLVRLFNLWIDVDAGSRTVTIENASGFFLQPDAAYDITRKVGPKDFTISPPPLPRATDFIWNADEDDYLTKTRTPDYDYLFEPGIANATERAEIDSGIFASTEFREWLFVQNNLVGPQGTATAADFVNPQFGVVEAAEVPAIMGDSPWNEAQNSFAAIEYDYQPRLLIASGFRRLNVPYNIRITRIISDSFGSTFFDEIQQYDGFAQLRFLDGNNTAARALRSLAWNGAAGLFALLYEGQYNKVAAGYEAEADILMTGYDYREMKINRPIAYDGNLYALKAIKNYSPLKGGLTKIVLVSWFG